VYRELGEKGKEAAYDDVLELLKAHPEWTGINQQVEQKPW
jgi:hypothetical protein